MRCFHLREAHTSPEDTRLYTENACWIKVMILRVMKGGMNVEILQQEGETRNRWRYGRILEEGSYFPRRISTF